MNRELPDRIKSIGKTVEDMSLTVDVRNDDVLTITFTDGSAIQVLPADSGPNQEKLRLVVNVK